LPKGAITVSFQIMRDGVPSAIGYTPNAEPWSDGVFYFRTAAFQRSGHYTLSFFVEGLNTALVKPLIYEVTVQSRTVLCGPQCALDRLNAQGFVKSEGRRVSLPHRQSLEKLRALVNTDLDAVRAALITVYLALPLGCLNISDNEEEGLTQGLGWNDILENAWVTTLEAATPPTEIMECTLLLESCIAKTSIQPSSAVGPIMNALPNPHFAIRCATLGAAPLRIFVLDKVINYSVFVVEGKKTRSGRADSAKPERRAAKGSKSKAAGGDFADDDDEVLVPRQSGRKKQRTSYVEEDDDEAEEM